MHFLISDGGQCRDHHVEAIEPRPALDEVISRRADGNNQHQESTDISQVAKGWHGVVQTRVATAALAVPAWATPHRSEQTMNDKRLTPLFPTHDYKTKRPSAQCGGPLAQKSTSVCQRRYRAGVD